MQGTIAQTVALTIAGNAVLQGEPMPPLWPDGSAFQFCFAVQFQETREATWGEHDPILASDPQTWLEHLQDQKCRGLQLRCAARNRPEISDRLGVGFIGGGSRWLIEELGSLSPAAWESAWRLWRRHEDAPDQRIWLVRYHRVAEPIPESCTKLDSLESASLRLREALNTIVAFATRNTINYGFVERFEQGLRALSSLSPLDGAYHKDFGPPGFLTLTALQVLSACQAAWVFGGMGSWNDGAYNKDLAPEGDELSQKLFEALQAGIAAVANSSLKR